MLQGRPFSFPSEAAPARGLPELTSSTVPEPPEPEPVAPLLQPRHRWHPAAISDNHPDFAPRCHPAKAGQSAPTEIAPRRYVPMPAPDGGGRHMLGDFLGRA